MWNWNNNTDCKYQIHYSRYIISWIRVGGKLRTIEDIGHFTTWLDRLGVNKFDIDDIVQMATNGKLELEDDAKRFLTKNQLD